VAWEALYPYTFLSFRKTESGPPLGKAGEADFIGQGNHERQAQSPVTSILATLHPKLTWMGDIDGETIRVAPGPKGDITLLFGMVHRIGAGFGYRQLKTLGLLLFEPHLSGPPLHEGPDGGERLGLGWEGLLGQHLALAITTCSQAGHDLPRGVPRARPDGKQSEADTGWFPLEQVAFLLPASRCSHPRA
jgi:hypothetical protein